MAGAARCTNVPVWRATLPGRILGPVRGRRRSWRPAGGRWVRSRGVAAGRGLTARRPSAAGPDAGSEDERCQAIAAVADAGLDLDLGLAEAPDLRRCDLARATAYASGEQSLAAHL